MIDILWFLVLICFAISLICGSMGSHQFYYYERIWSGIALVFMLFVIVLGGTAMYLTSKVCEDPNVVWDRCYRDK